MNGINKYVAETSEEIPTENVELFISTRKLVAKAKPRQKPVVNLSSNSVPANERKWIDIAPQPFDHSCFKVSKFRTRTLRHEASSPRDEDGAVKFDDSIAKLKDNFLVLCNGRSKLFVNSLAQGGGRNKRFPYCLNPCSSIEFLFFRAIQGHSGEKFVGPLLQDKNCYRMTSPSTSTTSGTPTRCTPFFKVDWSQVSVLHSREHHGRLTWSTRSWIRSGQTQNRTVQTHLESSSQYSILVQFKACSEKGIAIPSNSIACNYSFKHSTCDL